MDEIKAIPRNQYLGLLADGLRKAQESTGVVGDFLLGDAPRTLDQWSYGFSPVRMGRTDQGAAGALYGMQVDPGLVDVAGVAGMLPVAGRVAGWAGKEALRSIDDAMLGGGNSMVAKSLSGISPRSISPKSSTASNAPELRSVDLFGNGSRVQYFDDAKGHMYEAQYLHGPKKHKFEIYSKDGTGSYRRVSDKRFDSLDEAISSTPKEKASATRKANYEAKYGGIKSLSGEARKVAKKIIDAGYEISRVSGSTQSRSKYLELEDGTKIRISDHNLPSSYDSPDIDFRYGSDPSSIIDRLMEMDLIKRLDK